jgi:ATP-dependent DNA helicase DinG
MSALEKKPKLEPVNPERTKSELANLDPAESTKLDLEETSKQFPYASYRPGQRAALEAARDAFKRGKKYVVVEAPTGAGKSGIAVTLAREAKNAYILTGQKLLQDQYVRDFPDLAVVKGRANYPCLVVDTHAGAAPCMAGKKYPACSDCTYLIAKEDALFSHTATLNYAYFLGEINNTGAFQKRDLLILDEAHNTEELLMRFVEVFISRPSLMRAGLNLDFPHTGGIEERLQFASDLIMPLTKALTDIEIQLEKLEVIPPDMAVFKSELEGTLNRLRLLRDDEGSGWVCEESDARDAHGPAWLRFRPIRVSTFAHDFVFKHADRVLFLSATILDAPTFLRSLGITLEEAAFIRVPSSFPVKNRPIYPLNVARLNRDTLDSELPRIAEVIGNLLERHNGEKGVIHAHSYKILRFLTEHLPSHQQYRLVYHTGPEGRDDALGRHLSSDTDTVLLTPSMTEGIDLADDRARWQVIVKVPYPYLGDPQVNARRNLDPAWYEWRTALRMVQAYGRAVRGPEDFATTYVLDAVFPSWVQRARKTLPSWFLEAISKVQ